MAPRYRFLSGNKKKKKKKTKEDKPKKVKFNGQRRLEQFIVTAQYNYSNP